MIEASNPAASECVALSIFSPEAFAPVAESPKIWKVPAPVTSARIDARSMALLVEPAVELKNTWVVLGAMENGVPLRVRVTGVPLISVSRAVRSLVRLQSMPIV